MLALGITLGDVTGIGPEVALKALAREVIADEDTRYVLLGDNGVVREMCGLLGIESDLPRWRERASVPSRVYVHDPEPEPLPAGLPAGAPEAARAAVRWLREGARLCLAGELAGIVTAPVSKEAIIRAGQPFVGQTEFLSGLADANRTAMMLLGHDDRKRWLRVALATTHLPLKDVAAALTVEGVAQAIELAAEACARLGLARRRIGVCGLNPHAGEGGKMGREEIEVIAPAVVLARSRGVDCHGPAAADTLFHRVFLGDFDAVVAMYHDQGLVPLKMVAFDNGVNWTLGLPFVRTSPDHGTAYDLVGQGRADPSSMEAAIQLARQLAKG
ncbi:MAG TPA: 4-hydroxythreonine-4-phosphate dehydrogenase PdxA [Candidatus Limnocylindria bacterium]|nr:4-hydroxythreonine-4-phosphate dehydrogenase PdxA [Candidatus Limnocylindria bacterium]